MADPWTKGGADSPAFKAWMREQQLREALERYGTHDFECHEAAINWESYGKGCNCGWDDTLAALKATTGEPSTKPLEMWLCEAGAVVLQPRAYVFKVDPDCALCLVAAEDASVVDASPLLSIPKMGIQEIPGTRIKYKDGQTSRHSPAPPTPAEDANE